MTKLQTWILRKIFANLFIQGSEHHNNVARVYQLAREVWHEEFTEDNRPTTDAMLREAFNATQFDVRNDEMNEDTVQLMKQLAMDKGCVFSK